LVIPYFFSASFAEGDFNFIKLVGFCCVAVGPLSFRLAWFGGYSFDVVWCGVVGVRVFCGVAVVLIGSYSPPHARHSSRTESETDSLHLGVPGTGR